MNTDNIQKWAKEQANNPDKKLLNLLQIELDELSCDDFFGTERQDDPRGSYRDIEPDYESLECDEDGEYDEYDCEDSINSQAEELDVINKYNIIDVMDNLINSHDAMVEDRKVYENIFYNILNIEKSKE